MKRIILIILCLVLGVGLVLSGCSSQSDLDRSKGLVQDYYKFLENDDIDAAIGLFSQETIDAANSPADMGGEIRSRALLMGGMEKYTLVNSIQRGDGADLTYAVKYKYGTLEEMFTTTVENGNLVILSANLDQEIKSSVFISKFFTAYGDGDYDVAMEYFNKTYLEETTKDGFVKLLDAVKSISGEYKSSMPMSGNYTYVPTSDDVTTLAITQYRLDGDMRNMVVRMQIGIEDNELGFTYLNFYPAEVFEVNEAFSQNVIRGDIQGIMNMYSDMFYETVDGGRDTWEELMVQMRSEFGVPSSYEMLNWSLVEVDGSDGNKYSGVSMDVVRSYPNISFNETIVVIDEDGQNKIYYHTFKDGSGDVAK